MDEFETLANRGFQIDGQPLKPQTNYDAASSGRRLKSWTPGSAGPTRSVISHLSTVRARSRDAVRNNGWIANGVGNWTANEVGTGIKPRSACRDREFAAMANELWENTFRQAADFDEQLDVYGLMALAVRSRKEAGEIFVKRHHLPLNGKSVPIQFQLIEGDQVPHNLNEVRGDSEIVAGVEFRGGKRHAYWMYPRHPSDTSTGTTQPVPVPANQVAHHFAPLRPGQVRGIAETVQALIKARDFDEYDDAELTRKKTRADYTGVIKRQQYDEDDFKFDPFTGDPLGDDGGVPVVSMQPGSFPALMPGEEIQLFDGDQGGNYGDFMRQQLLGVAASMGGIPYELLSGDMRNVNDRILRAILNEYHRRVEQYQWLYTIPQLCQWMWESFIDAAVLAGLLRAPDFATRRADYVACSWRPQAWRYLHPVQDAQGELMLIAGGLGSREAAAADRGYDVEEIDMQNRRDADRAARLGLSYSHDPLPVKDEQ